MTVDRKTAKAMYLTGKTITLHDVTNDEIWEFKHNANNKLASQIRKFNYIVAMFIKYVGNPIFEIN